MSVIDDFETADRVYNLRASANRLAASGEIAEAGARAWIESLEGKGHRGSFAAELTAYTVIGHKEA